jgi:hypothetical protein
MFAKLLRTAPVSPELEMIKLEFLIFPFALLGIGIVTSSCVFAFELLLFKTSG